MPSPSKSICENAFDEADLTSMVPSPSISNPSITPSPLESIPTSLSIMPSPSKSTPSIMPSPS